MPSLIIKVLNIWLLPVTLKNAAAFQSACTNRELQFFLTWRISKHYLEPRVREPSPIRDSNPRLYQNCGLWKKTERRTIKEREKFPSSTCSWSSVYQYHACLQVQCGLYFKSFSISEENEMTRKEYKRKVDPSNFAVLFGSAANAAHIKNCKRATPQC